MKRKMPKSRISLFVLTLFLGVTVLPGQILPRATPKDVGLSQERLDRIKAQQEKYLSQNQLAGGVILIARRGKMAYLETFGFQDKESGKPMRVDTIFGQHSMTKPIIAVAALTLYEQGKYSLLDPVSKYLPEFKDMKVAVDKMDTATGKRAYSLVPAERQITILDLFRHTSGMTNRGPADENGDLIFQKLNYNSHPMTEGIKLLASAPLVHQPGTGFDYSPGPDVIGRLIELWSGQALEVYMQEHLFGPLHMVDSGFWAPEEKWGRVVTMYTSGKNGEIARASAAQQEMFNATKKPVFPRGRNGLVSTAVDYARFAQMLVNGGELDGVHILSPKTVELMSSDLLGNLPVYGGPMLPGHGFGLTVAVNRGPAKTATIGSVGEYYWEGGAANDFFVDPKEKLITVYMVAKMGGIAISREYKRMVYQSLVEAN
jgi:CubicO group peptidase (beta-lactamase class C family)